MDFLRCLNCFSFESHNHLSETDDFSGESGRLILAPFRSAAAIGTWHAQISQVSFLQTPYFGSFSAHLSRPGLVSRLCTGMILFPSSPQSPELCIGTFESTEGQKATYQPTAAQQQALSVTSLPKGQGTVGTRSAFYLYL